MKIASFLDRNDVTVAVPAGTKREVLSALVDLLVSNHPELDGELLLQILLRREELRSTGIEQGVAFPHGRVPGLENLLSCFGRCKEGTDFESFDGNRTQFFFVLLIPENTQGIHLKALAKLNRLFMDEKFRKELIEAKDAGTLFNIIIEKEKHC
jgi:PTS system nitrogen regulatory IIA component